MKRSSFDRRRYLLLLGLACMVPGCLPAPRQSTIEEARREIDFIPAQWQGEPVIILSDTFFLTVKARPGEGNILSHSYIGYYFINARNPAFCEKMEFIEHTSIEEKPVIKATAYYPEGKTWNVSSADFTVAPYVYQEQYRSDDMVHSFIIPDYRPGMLIKLEVTRTFTSPEYVSRAFLRSEFPNLHRSVVFSHPADYEILTRFRNTEGCAADTATATAGRVKRIEIHAAMLRKMPEEEARPEFSEEWYAGLYFSIPPEGMRSYSWRQLGDCYLQSIESVFKPSPLISAWASAISSTRRDAIVADAFKIQQNRVRYYANFENAHAFIPRPAAEVAAKGYGDCKEMSALLKAVVSQKGIGLGLALVSTEGIPQCIEAIPSLGCFNHAIAYSVDDDSAVRFYDPTVSFGTPENSYFHLVGRKAFLIEKNKSSIVVIGKGAGYTNVIETNSRIFPAPETGAWELDGSIVLRGGPAFSFFPAFCRMQGDDARLFLVRFLEEYFGVIAIGNPAASASSDTVVIRYRAAMQRNYLHIEKGGLQLSVPSIFNEDSRNAVIGSEGPRRFTAFEQYDVWKIPGDFTELEKRELRHRLGFGEWSGPDSTVRRTFRQKEELVQPECHPECGDYFTQKDKFMKSSVWRR